MVLTILLLLSGELDDDERNGHGTLEYGTGEVYEGEFKNDKLRKYSPQYYCACFRQAEMTSSCL